MLLPCYVTINRDSLANIFMNEYESIAFLPTIYPKLVTNFYVKLSIQGNTYQKQIKIIAGN